MDADNSAKALGSKVLRGWNGLGLTSFIETANAPSAVVVGCSGCFAGADVPTGATSLGLPRESSASNPFPNFFLVICCYLACCDFSELRLRTSAASA